MLEGPQYGPASGGTAKQLVILLHGLGSNGNDLIQLAKEIAPQLPDAYFMSPNAPYENDMAPIGKQWFSLRNQRTEGLLSQGKQSAQEVNALVDSLLDELKLNDSQLAFIGFSQGSMLSLYTALRRPNPCAGVVAYSGALIAPELLASEQKSKPAICLVHGEEDEVVPFQAMVQAESELKRAGVRVESHPRPYLAHGIDPEGLRIGVTFLKKQLLKSSW